MTSKFVNTNDILVNKADTKYASGNEKVRLLIESNTTNTGERYESIIRPISSDNNNNEISGNTSPTSSPESVVKSIRYNSLSTLLTLVTSYSRSSSDDNLEDDDKTLLINNHYDMNEKRGASNTKSAIRINLGQFLHSKLLLSFFIWIVCYVTMAILGGSVAFFHFPRVFPESLSTVPLPDFGYDIIPYWCPMLGDVENTNPQSIILFFFYIVILVGACNKPKPQGRLVLQRLLHLNSLLFLMRTTTVGLTGLPQPNPRCQPIQSIAITYSEAIQFVFRSVLPHACGDLVFSGHVSCIFTCMVILHKHQILSGIWTYFGAWIVSLLSVFSVISCRSHYSVDVVLAFYFVYFTQDWYYSRCHSYTNHSSYSQNVVHFIAWLEDRQPFDKDPTQDKEQGEHIKTNSVLSNSDDVDYDYYPYCYCNCDNTKPSHHCYQV